MVDRGLSFEEAESEATLTAMAGADPVATAIRASLLYTLTNPQVHSRLMSEIESLKTSPLDSLIPYKTLRTLPYLSAVIKESFRIFPPFVGILEKEVPPAGDYTPDGRFLPGGTFVGASLVAILRDTSVFGPDAQIFRPERWLQCSDMERLLMERSLELVFSGGRYTCLGKDVAIMEIYKVIFELLRSLRSHWWIH